MATSADINLAIDKVDPHPQQVGKTVNVELRDNLNAEASSWGIA